MRAKWLQTNASPLKRARGVSSKKKSPLAREGCINGKSDPRGPSTAATVSTRGFHPPNPQMCSVLLSLYFSEIVPLTSPSCWKSFPLASVILSSLDLFSCYCPAILQDHLNSTHNVLLKPLFQALFLLCSFSLLDFIPWIELTLVGRCSKC